MSRRDDVSQARSAGIEAANENNRAFPLDPSRGVMLFIGEPPSGTETVAGVSAPETSDPEQLATRLRRATATAARIERVGERLRLNVEQFLEAMEAVADAHPAVDAAGDPTSHLSAHEEATLREMGLLRSAPPAGATRPSTLAALRYGELLVRTLTVKEAAVRLGVTEGRIRQRLNERSLYGISTSQGWRLPEFQFAEHGALPGIERVLPALNAGLHPLAVEGFFTRSQPDLEFEGEAVSPVEWLAAGGDPTVVAELANDLLRTA
ncbi:hypothetical protein NMQ03_09540 [Arthrobacter sp. DNA4]|uniref:hypothetical protein n=1 Tax=Arthrobacter sp. DNA4 TaxID=2963432 RepID=UPI0020CBCFAF|nr:hypothetical protein [Arthrobacter sp. DNA4]UTT71294.1 hypothetical protein NMQ03_09540 [Arthrobacter sp. DNA4]